METLTADHVAIVWMLAGVGLIALEAMSVPGIGFLFAGLGAITAGALITFGVIDGTPESTNLLKQTLVFLLATSMWAAVLWKPMKRFVSRKSIDGYNDMVGQTATICNADLHKGKVGKVKWSGTIMRAILDDEAPVDHISINQEVVIKRVDGKTLVVTTNGD